MPDGLSQSADSGTYWNRPQWATVSNLKFVLVNSRPGTSLRYFFLLEKCVHQKYALAYLDFLFCFLFLNVKQTSSKSHPSWTGGPLLFLNTSQTWCLPAPLQEQSHGDYIPCTLYQKNKQTLFHFKVEEQYFAVPSIQVS